MRKAICKFLLFIVIFAVIDKCSGLLLCWLCRNAKPSYIKNLNSIEQGRSDDILILGSSRAMHHYDPRIIEDSLNLTCFNGGAMSNGIVLMYGIFKLYLKKHIPKILIYDIHPPFDLELEEKSKYLQVLRPYYDNEVIQSLLIQIDYKEKYKNISYLYRYNSQAPVIIASFLKEAKNLFKGYAPLFNKMQNDKEFEQPKNIKLDELKLQLFQRMIADCKNHNIKLVFMVSPAYKKDIHSQIGPIKRFCEDYNIPLFIHDNDTSFSNKDLFYDSVHLNDIGVKKYMGIVLSNLKQIDN